ncbi:MAG: TetR/AcrR family transcriptional regulator [Bacteroidetes bacterium]|nr:TetR/AcrR family transcriptional regulator [Bacteroidota bacterium]
MSPKSPTQFTAIREKSRAKILKAAVELFSKYGYLEVSVSRIAEKAGVAKGLLYNYFHSKEAVLKAIVDLMMSDMQVFMESVAGEERPKVKIERMIRLSFRMFREKAAFYKNIMSIITQSGVPSKIKKPLNDFLAEAVAELEETFRLEGVENPRIEALKLGAILDGVAWHYLFVFGESYPLDNMENELVKRYTGTVK